MNTNTINQKVIRLNKYPFHRCNKKENFAFANVVIEIVHACLKMYQLSPISHTYC